MRFLFPFLVVGVVDRINSQEAFVAKKNNTYVCVTNSYFALTWNRKFIQVYESRYIPEPQSNTFDCKISSDLKTKDYFQKKPWYARSYTNGNAVLDQRWEDFTVYSVFPNPENPASEFYKITKNHLNNFQLSFSVKNKHSAVVFLCDSKSNCYRFLLEGKKSNATRCSGMNNSNETLPSCKNLPSEMKHSEFRKPEDSWSHFRFVRKEHTISLETIGGLEDGTVLDIPGDEQIEYMYFGSLSVQTFWKFHQVFCIFTNKTSEDVQLGPPITVKENFVCISMLVVMCNFCQLKLKLESDGFLIGEKIFRSQNNNEQWFEIKFIVDDISRDIQFNKMLLFVSTISTSQDNTEVYWGIDEVRLCQKNEFRMISLSEPANCQLMTKTTQIISFNHSTELVPYSVTNCSENTIGSFCVPCNLLFDNCDKIKICSGTCWCSAGFRVLPDCEDSNLLIPKLFHHSYQVNRTISRFISRVRIIVAENEYSSKSATVDNMSSSELSFLSKIKCLGSDHTITLEISPTVNKSFDVIVLVSDNNDYWYDHPELKIDFFGVNLNRYRRVKELRSFDGRYPIVIGDEAPTTSNYPLAMNTSYNVVLVFIDSYKGKTRSNFELLACSTTVPSKYLYWYCLLLLPAAVLMVLLFLLYKRKTEAYRTAQRKKEEPIYTKDTDARQVNNKFYASARLDHSYEQLDFELLQVPSPYTDRKVSINQH